jgi:hypothetical protein
MRIWCMPISTRLDQQQRTSSSTSPSPLLPPRIDRDVFYRSPPPPPRLSRQERLDKGVIVLKPKHKKQHYQRNLKTSTQSQLRRKTLINPGGIISSNKEHNIFISNIIRIFFTCMIIFFLSMSFTKLLVPNSDIELILGML